MPQIKLYEPAILIVGTRGRNLKGFQGLLPGSVSKFCLQNSPIPVIVVRPNSQRARTKRKRQKDPSRHGYKDLLDKAGADGSDIFVDVNEEGAPASDDEAAAVAAAIGIKTAREAKGSPLVKVQSAHVEEEVPTAGIVSDRDMSPDELQLRRASTTSASVDELAVDGTKTGESTIETTTVENGVNADDKGPES
jgi:nucleotide-binding universal stress UspA family protein